MDDIEKAALSPEVGSAVARGKSPSGVATSDPDNGNFSGTGAQHTGSGTIRHHHRATSERLRDDSVVQGYAGRKGTSQTAAAFRAPLPVALPPWSHARVRIRTRNRDFTYDAHPLRRSSARAPARRIREHHTSMAR